jgi:nicotinate-nucleotide adenylyltransferase
MRVGYFGGTFDPIHRGHLDVAEAARRALGLTHVYFVPADVPPHRQAPKASAAHRFAMVALALAPTPTFLVSDLEMRAGEPSYTSVTLDRLVARGVDTRTCCLITGADAFADIPSWKDYPAILDRCHMAVVSRPAHPAPQLRDTLPSIASRMILVDPSRVTPLPGSPGILLVDAPTAPVSSTGVRRCIAAGSPVHGLVPAAVEEYIQKHGLYVEQA